jgi:hypothetical protein
MGPVGQKVHLQSSDDNSGQLGSEDDGGMGVKPAEPTDWKTHHDQDRASPCVAHCAKARPTLGTAGSEALWLATACCQHCGTLRHMPVAQQGLPLKQVSGCKASDSKEVTVTLPGSCWSALTCGFVLFR